MANKFFRLQRIKQQLRRFLAIPFILSALVLFCLSVKSNLSVFDEVNTFSYAQLSPFITKISKPFETVWLKVASIQNYFDVYEENERLRYENNILKGWQNTALKLALEQKELVRSLNYQPVENKKGMIVRVLSEYNSPFSHSVVLEGGKNHGINKGDVLILNNSLFGHVIEVNDNYSRALKLTDYFSRLPVLVGENKELGMMIGDNTENPELSAFQEEVQLNEGDFVMTAGLAGVYPQGIGIGVVKKVGETFKVELFENKNNISFVRVIDFSLGGLIDDLDEKAGE